MSGDARQKMIAGALRLLAQRGLEGTSFREVVAATGAPRGSIYHHFPDGKEQLVAEAVDLAGARAGELIDTVAGQSAEEVTAFFVGMWRELLVRSGLRAGCAVLAVTVATESSELLEHTSAVFHGWRAKLAGMLADGGLSATDAARFSATVIAACEGAVVLARAEQDLEPFDLVAEQLLEQCRQLSREP